MCGAELTRRAGQLFERFRGNRSGGILIYTTLMLPVLFGVTLLSIDASRVYTLQTSLQKAADAFALASAAELDRNGDAITRADNARATLVANSQKFGVTPGTVAVTARYLTGLPASDATPIDASYTTTTATVARFVEVTVTPVQLDTFFPATYIGAASNSVTTGAVAVAGFGSAICKVTPMFMCNPYEGTGVTLAEAANNPVYKRRQFALKKKGGTDSQYSAGNYGFLEPYVGNPGAANIGDMLAMENPAACFSADGVNLQPGFIESVNDDLNVRFDLFPNGGGPNARQSNPNMRPARNVTKGYAIPVSDNGPGNGSFCNSAESATPPDAMGLPRDSAFPDANGRMGNGTWDFDQYWTVNHGAAAKPTDSNGVQYSNSNLPSRYKIYRYEVDNNLIPNVGTGTTRENGNAQCHANGSVDQPGLDRRVIYAAVLNCNALISAGYTLQGSTGENLPVVAFMKFFLTEPAASDTDKTIYVEITDIVSPGNNGGNDVARDIVQLYR